MKWGKLVMEEFWNQGDKEKKLGLPISNLCDRETVSFCQGQFGFIKFVVLPYYESISFIFEDLKFMSDNASSNLKEIQKLKEEEESN